MPDPDLLQLYELMVLIREFEPEAERQYKKARIGGYCHLATGQEAATVGEAIRKWQQAEDILVHDMPVIPLRFGQNVYGHSPRLAGVSMDSAQRIDLYSVQVVG